jgi:hypothetical protein
VNATPLLNSLQSHQTFSNLLVPTDSLTVGSSSLAQSRDATVETNFNMPGLLHTPITTMSHPLDSGLQGVEFTPLSSIPGATIEQFVGRVRVTVIKEIWNYKDKADGLGSFVHTLLVEAHTLCRAHVMSRNGNALLGYFVDELRVIEEKGTQVYAILSLGGDAARVLK